MRLTNWTRKAIKFMDKADKWIRKLAHLIGTANTNQLIIETIIFGLQLPSCSFTSPHTEERKLLIEKTVERVKK